MDLCFLVSLHSFVGRYHRHGSPGSAQSLQFFWAQSLFAQHVHWYSGVNHEFSFLCSFLKSAPALPWLQQESKTQFYPYFFELVDIFRQVPCYSAGASFLLQGFVLCSFVLPSNLGAHGLRSWGSHFWIIPRDGPFLSRFLMWCHVPLENLTVWFDPNFPSFP